MIMGYEVTDYADMWRLYVHDNKVNPKDLFELLEYWEKFPRHTPRDQVELAMKLSEAYFHVDVTEVFKMVERFLNTSYGVKEPAEPPKETK